MTTVALNPICHSENEMRPIDALFRDAIHELCGHDLRITIPDSQHPPGISCVVVIKSGHGHLDECIEKCRERFGGTYKDDRTELERGEFEGHSCRIKFDLA